MLHWILNPPRDALCPLASFRLKSLFRLWRVFKSSRPFIFLLLCSWVQHGAYILWHTNERNLEQQATEANGDDTSGDRCSWLTSWREHTEPVEGQANRPDTLWFLWLAVPWARTPCETCHGPSAELTSEDGSGQEDSFHTDNYKRHPMGECEGSDAHGNLMSSWRRNKPPGFFLHLNWTRDVLLQIWMPGEEESKGNFIIATINSSLSKKTLDPVKKKV